MYYIIIKTDFEGFHRYKDAPKEVDFLQYFHRHIFKVEAMIEVNHDNRDEEFFIIKRKLDLYLEATFRSKKFEYSCEQVSKMIFHFLRSQGLKCLSVEVSEDGENIGGYYHK